jgi:hypothetical protein
MACPPWPSPSSSRESAMHSELVTTMSISMVRITMPTTSGPISAASSGTPMKPVLGKAATSAPSEASFQRMRAFMVMAMVKATITSAHTRYTPITEGSSSVVMGVVEPKR